MNKPKRKHVRFEHLSEPYLADAVEVMAHAFHGNPVARCALAELEDKERVPKLRRMFRGVLTAAMKHGKVYIVRRQGRVAAVSVSYPPGGYPLPVQAELTNSFGRMTMGMKYSFRYSLYDGYFRKLHIKEPHWYLYFMGVVPEAQGKGLGVALIEHINRVADAEKVPCYLETDQEEMVRFYERYGYAVEHNGTVRGLKGLEVWTMLRPAKAQRSA